MTRQERITRSHTNEEHVYPRSNGGELGHDLIIGIPSVSIFLSDLWFSPLSASMVPDLILKSAHILPSQRLAGVRGEVPGMVAPRPRLRDHSTIWRDLSNRYLR